MWHEIYLAIQGRAGVQWGVVSRETLIDLQNLSTTAPVRSTAHRYQKKEVQLVLRPAQCWAYDVHR